MAKSLIDEALRLEYIDFMQREKADKYKKETGMSEDTVIRETKIMSDEALAKLYSDVYHIPIGKTEEINARGYCAMQYPLLIWQIWNSAMPPFLL